VPRLKINSFRIHLKVSSAGLRRDKQIARIRKKIAMNFSTPPIFPHPAEAPAVPEAETFVRKFNKEFRTLRVPNYGGINT